MRERTPASYRTLDDEALLTPADVAALFEVDPKTVTRWAKAGRVPRDPDTGLPGTLKTFGGHRRFRWGVIRRVLSGEIEIEFGARPGNNSAPDTATGSAVV